MYFKENDHVFHFANVLHRFGNLQYTVQLDLNLMLASTVPAFKIARIACAQP